MGACRLAGGALAPPDMNPGLVRQPKAVLVKNDPCLEGSGGASFRETLERLSRDFRETLERL